MPLMQREGWLIAGNSAQVFIVRLQRLDLLDTGYGFYGNSRRERVIGCYAVGQY